MTTRGGGAAGFIAPGAAACAAAGSETGAGDPSPPPLADCAPGFCGKRGMVFAAGAPDALDGREAPSGPEGGRVRLGIGFVTAVDHAGGTF
jgi:hypothetical protein